MSAPNRTALLTRLYRTLKKHYKPVLPNLKMPLLEQMLFACCLQDATPPTAEKAYAALEEQYFDWNEVRVSTVTELSETLSMLHEAPAAASRVKRILQGVFESTYSFDLETLKKQNIGAAVKRLTKLDGSTPFAVAYVTQTSLGGHAIPLSGGALEVLLVLGLVNEKEKASGAVTGLERAIPKSKGIEFGSLLHQLGIDFQRSPFAASTRKLILSISPDARDRFPKRGAKTSETGQAGPAQPTPASTDGPPPAAAPAAAATGPKKKEPPAKPKAPDRKPVAGTPPKGRTEKKRAAPADRPPARKPAAARSGPRKPR